MSSRPLWQTISDCLPHRYDDEWYEIRDIAPLLGLAPRSLRDHCRDIWPSHEGHWRLSRADAERVIRRVVLAGHNVHRKFPLKTIPPFDRRLAAVSRFQARTER